jgi:hypothetical protein
MGLMGTLSFLAASVVLGVAPGGSNVALEKKQRCSPKKARLPE